MIFDLYHGDCLEVMAGLSDASVDLILCDLPYGTMPCKWDSVIPLEPLWAQYRRIAKKSAAVVLTAAQPFTTALIASNLREFRYCWVWDKKLSGNPFLAKRQPLRRHEDICVFGGPSYNPQMTVGKLRKKGGGRTKMFGWSHRPSELSDQYYPTTILEFSNAQRGLHPTQKPVALMEYLIRTYTHEGEVVLDNCMGSGTTGVACANTGRAFIGIERDDKYFAIASERIAAAQQAAA